MKGTTINRTISFTGVFSILMGGLIYLGLRPDSLLMFKWTKLIGLDGHINAFRELCSPYSYFLPVWLIYCAPNGLWMLSFTCFMIIVWGNNQPTQIILWSLCLLSVAILSECMQLISLVSGVFDPIDVLSYIAGCLIGLAFLTKGRIVNE